MKKLDGKILVQIKNNYEDRYKFHLVDEVETYSSSHYLEFKYIRNDNGHSRLVEEICTIDEVHNYIPTMSEHFRTYDFDNFGFWELSEEVLFWILTIIISPILLGLYLYDKVTRWRT